MADPSRDPDEEFGGVPADVLARAKRVGPDADLGSDTEPEAPPELEPWEIPPEAPRPPRLREQSVEAVFDRLRELTLAQARAFQRAYQAIPRSELGIGGWAPGLGSPADQTAEPPTMEQISRGRALLREGALREARASGAERDVDALTASARETAVEALSHASLRGGGLEEATVAAETAAQDVAVALTIRPWIAEWRFQELVEPWARAFTVDAVEAHSFDALGALALAFGVMAMATLGIGRSSLNAADLPAIIFGLLAVIVLLLRWRLRRHPAAA